MVIEERNGGGEESLSSIGTERLKFYCSHGGKILPRPSDGTLKYIAGETRVVVVPRSITFYELRKKINDIFDGEYVLKYQIAMEDLDSLVSVRSDEDIRHMVDEYDRLERGGTSKLRTFLFPVKHIVVESQPTLAGLAPHAMDQRFIEAVNGVVRSTNLAPKLHLTTTHLKSFSPSPNEGSPQSLSPRSTATHNSSLLQENSLISTLQSRLARVQKVQSSPNLCTLIGHQNYGTLYGNNYLHQQPHCHHCPTPQHQHNHHGYQSPIMPQDHLIHTQHGYQSPIIQNDQHTLSHHSCQSPSTTYDHMPFTQPMTARSKHSKLFLDGEIGHHNASYHHAMSRGYPGSGGHRRWDHLEQYTIPTYGSRHLVRPDGLPRSPDDTWG